MMTNKVSKHLTQQTRRADFGVSTQLQGRMMGTCGCPKQDWIFFEIFKVFWSYYYFLNKVTLCPSFCGWDSMVDLSTFF